MVGEHGGNVEHQYSCASFVLANKHAVCVLYTNNHPHQHRCFTHRQTPTQHAICVPARSSTSMHAATQQPTSSMDSCGGHFTLKPPTAITLEVW